MLLSKKLKGFWTDLRLAVSGNDLDFTTGSIGRAVFLLSVPMILEMVMESVFAVADIYFVSKLGKEAVSAVGITESLMTIVYALGIGLSTGTAALVSRRIGEKDKEAAANTAVQSIILALLFSAVISAVGWFFSSELLVMMGASDEAIRIGGNYTRFMLLSNAVIMLLFVINAVFRSAGDANISMLVLWIANGINIVLDPLFIFGYGIIPPMGVEGAAYATFTGRGLAVAVQLYLLFKGSKRIKIFYRHIKADMHLMWKLLKVSAGGIGQSLIATSGWIFLIRIIASFGSVAVAGYTIAIRILLFTILPSWGMSNAAATLTGQNLGAKRSDRAERTVWMTAYINMIFLSVVAIVLISFSEFFIRMFIDDPEVIEKGVIGLRYISYSLFAYSLGMVLIQAFNGSGMTRIPTLLNFICFWVLEIPLAYYLSHLGGYGEKGVYMAIIAGDLLLTLLAFILFKQGKWKTAVV